MINFSIGFGAIIGTLILYLFAFQFHKRFSYTFTSPVIIVTVAIVVVLMIFTIPYEKYMLGGEWISKLLGPAVVALAYPLYQQRDILKKLTVPILGGTFFGAVLGVTTGILLAKWSGVDNMIIYSLTPKSVTTPVAMDIADTLGGVEPLAAVFVMVAGIGGILVSSVVFKYSSLTNYLGRGVGIGSASHAIGTATAMENSQLEGSVSTIAMVVSAVIVSVITPGLIWLLL
ncbi:LrgB family protein [Virgibacillus sp. C22-A2]|uniref:LrgB family protein n=1 Tax=Virgibacillus tibetensis TaxID=3042313 RepID=A0ABU6KFJ0_9BACI|nr:LrgB family protein [Virgibacillus sp. C22-A2]